MTQEEKQLLLKDLCNRLPYGVKVKILDPDVLPYETSDVGTIVGKEHIDDDYTIRCEKGGWILEVNRHFIPYLRPMSSMTEEEKREVRILWNEDFVDVVSLYHCYPKTTDFYNTHHLDYRGLIGKGLALEAPEGMYKTE